MSTDTVPEPLAGQPRTPGARSGTGAAEEPAFFPLTIAQTPIALDSLALPDSPVANTGDMVHIDAAIDVSVFAEACRRVIAETATLRASLRYRGGTLQQEFPALEDYKLELQDCSGAERPQEAAMAWIEKQFWLARPWNSFPLFQFALVKIRDDHFIFLQKFHHVLSDAIGRFQCFQRIAAVYEALIQGLEPTAPSETASFASRIAEEAAYLESDAYRKDLAYWTGRLDNLPEPLVDADRGKSERGLSGRPMRVSHAIASQDFARLQQSATALGSSVPRLVLALAYVAIARLYGVGDIIIGTPGHNRSSQAAKRSMSLAMTVMPFRMQFESTATIAQMLKEIAALQMAARRHGRFPFASLTRSGGQGEAGQGIFDVIVNYIPAMEPVSLGGTNVTYTNYSAGFYPPWAIDVRETHDGLGAELTVVFDHGLIDAGDGARLARCLHFLLISPVDLAQTIGTIPIMSAQDRHHLLVELNDNDVPTQTDATLASLCESQAERTPDAIAVNCGASSITYDRLHAKAQTMTRHLRAAGVGPEAIVGVALPKDIDLIVALLAIHKAGGAYLPLDPTLPAERLAYMIADARASVVVTTRALEQVIPDTAARRFFLDDSVFLDDPGPQDAPSAPAPAARPDNLAYIIYTSGSTGFPKGVAVEHRNAVNLLLCLAARTQPQDLSGILFSSSLNFDASVDEIFLPLITGGRVIIVETLLSLPMAPARGLARFVAAPPSVVEALLQIGDFELGDRIIRFGGEALPRSLVDRVRAAAPQIRIENGYGPTETTVYATIATVKPDDIGEPPIGKGLWNTKLYVLDQNRELMPKGAAGELYIGGAGVTRGYLNQPELTAERFLLNPFGEGRLYRTGDIVRWREDGALDYVNRADAQVKINGLRIELGEIERQLEAMPQIDNAVALVRSDDQGIKRIFAFAIARDASDRPDLFAVTMHLHGKLPQYMLPAALAWVDKFPMTSSGKLDRNALSLPDWRKSERPYRAPSNRIEESLAKIWAQVLNMPKVGIDEDFYELGGTSLQAVMIFAQIARIHGQDLPAIAMVNGPTIALQAKILEKASQVSDRTRLMAFREKGDGAPLFFVHGGGGGVMHVRDVMQDLRSGNPLYGLRPPPLDGTERLPRSIEGFAADYVGEIRAVQPAGPYHIIGYSSGGTIAYEMARQFMDMGETVSLLGLIETDTKRYVRNPAATPSGDHGRRLAQFRSRLTKMRKRAKNWVKQLPHELRHALGMPIPHDDRADFYTRRFIEAEIAYTPRRYSGAITLFTRRSFADWYRAKWVTLAAGELIICELAVARHLEIVALPDSRFLAMQLDTILGEKTKR
jgi:enterobactin synthetase component F